MSTNDVNQENTENQQSQDTTQEAMTSTEQEINTEIDPKDAKILELEAKLLAASDSEVQKQARDSVLRAQAEVQNIRRRTEQDIEKAHKFALEKIAKDLLSVIDNMERALESADKENESLKPMIEGVELTLKSLIDTVKRYGVEVIDQTNVPFNPDVHEAVTNVPSTDIAPNHVAFIMQKGYQLNGRLLRAAMVGVAK